MNVKGLLELSLFLQCGMDIGVLALMARRRALHIFPQVGYLIASDLLCSAFAVSMLYFKTFFHLTAHQAYYAWFISGWSLSAVILVLRIMTVYGIFAEAMRPLPGLHEAGKIIFRWVAVVSALVSIALLAEPGAFSGLAGWLNVVSKLQQAVSVLTLCLLTFVCFAVRPLGLTFRSHLFGVSLGLGIAATVELVQAAWSVTSGATTVYSPIFLFSSLGFCAALAVWGVYFALPDPKRKMILLPTTSPFFFWNRISEILGDSPGHVAVAGFTPDMLAPAEIEMLTAATSSETLSVTPEPEPKVRESLPRLSELDLGARPSLAL